MIYYTFKSWVDKLNSITINTELRDRVIKFYKVVNGYLNNKYILTQIKDKYLNQALDNIGSYKDLIICYDVEFQTGIVKGKHYYSLSNEIGDKFIRTSYFIRELGLLSFVKDYKENQWYYLGDIFVNFPPLSKFTEQKNIKYLQSTYATVTKSTLGTMELNDNKILLVKKIDQLPDLERRVYNKFARKLIKDLSTDKLFNKYVGKQKKKLVLELLSKTTHYEETLTERYKALYKVKRILKNAGFNILMKHLPKEFHKLFDNQWKMYLNDPIVKKRALNIKTTKYFLDAFEDISYDSYFVVKGRRDLYSLKNSFMLINRTKTDNFNFENIYDIEMFNGLSRNHFGSAQLEATFESLIQTKNYKNIKSKIFNQMLSKYGAEAHNPVVDALFTIVVATIINLILNESLTIQKDKYGIGRIRTTPLTKSTGSTNISRYTSGYTSGYTSRYNEPNELYKKKYYKYKSKYIKLLESERMDNLSKTIGVKNIKTIKTIKTIAEGNPGTMEYKLYFEHDGNRISPFHDIPLYYDSSNNIFNMVVEIPRGTKAKLEISKDISFNPIIQDTKKGKLRYVNYKDGYMWNYGAFPQTWEDPNHIHPATNSRGDNDPLDVVDIGSRVAKVGEIIQVKIVGIMALIDEGETDWKVIAIDIRDELASKINDIGDLEGVIPGILKETFIWFRDYKTVVGKPQNVFAFDGEPKGRDYALDIIDENHRFWKKLISGESPPNNIKLDKYI